MARYSDTVRDQNKVPVIGATVTVTNTDGSVPVLTDDAGNTLKQPLVTDGYGVFYFNLASGSFVDLAFYYGGRKAGEEFGVNIANTTQLVINQGTLAVSAPAIEITANLNDGLAPGDARPTFVGSYIDWTLTNVGERYHSFAQFKIAGNPVTRFTAQNGGVNTAMTFLNPAVPDDLVSFEQQQGGNGAAICHRLDFGNGRPAPVVSFFWDSVNAGSGPNTVGVMRGNGSNRFSIIAESSMNMESGTSRFEREGTGGSGRLQYVGYDQGSANGRTFDFTNFGQSPGRSNPVMSVSGQNAAEDILHISRYNGSAWTVLAKFDGTGRLTVPAIISTGNAQGAPGTATTGSTTETTVLTFNQPANAMGPSGQVEIEAYVSIIGTAAAKTLRIYYGGTVIYTQNITATSLGFNGRVRLANKTVSTQITMGGGTAGSGFTNSTTAPITAAINTSAAVPILITVQLGSAADSITLESYLIETHYGA